MNVFGLHATGDNPLAKQLAVLLGNKVSDYFTKPTIQSPVPQTQFPTQFQQNVGQSMQGMRDMGHLSQKPPTTQPVKPQMPLQAPPRSIPRAPTVTPTPQADSFADFTTTTNIPSDYKTLITASAQKYGLSPSLLASLLFTEHGFSKDPGWNKNGSGANVSWDRGPAQINTVAHPEVSDEQALDPNFAIPWAAKTLSGHIKNLGMKRGIIAYNTGATGSSQVKDPTQHPYYQKVTTGLSNNLKKQLGLL
ncbi:MAG: hypothetical protein C5B43_02290 [Verrucomicrobia bacterium]|nr:MAG: hypothetical protein C5B43_02290 [Verrucomicrobiota bacterium]